MQCKKCSGKIEENYSRLLPGMCFTCTFWTEQAQDQRDAVRIDGWHYRIGEDKGNVFRGHGGKRFTIKFYDGRIVNTSNLWHQGKIPEHFRAELPNNAEFVTTQAR